MAEAVPGGALGPASVQNTVVGFIGDTGQPPTEWLTCHAQQARETGRQWDTAALDGIIGIFDETIRPADLIVVPAREGFGENFTDDDQLPDLAVRIGLFRAFEFKVALWWAQMYHASSRQHTLDDTYESVIAGEIQACMGNFLCQTESAPELDRFTGRQRWRLTAPDDPDLTEFTGAYLQRLEELFDAGDSGFSDRLRDYSRALQEFIAGTVETAGPEFDRAAGRLHAEQVFNIVARKE